MTPTDDERKAQNEAIIQRVLDDARNGGYVFPQDLPDSTFPNGLRREGGLTLRDYFAARALSATTNLESRCDERVASACYKLADAMLSERAKCAK